MLFGPECLNNGRLSWKALVDEHEGKMLREPEKKRTRALLNHLRLDNHESGHERRSEFRGCAKRLTELSSTLSELARASALANQMTNQDHANAEETLKVVETSTLAKCYA